MIRPHGSPRRMLSFTDEELEEFAAEFAAYAAEEIADLLALKPTPALLHEIASEVAHAVHCTIEELPQQQSRPTLQLRHAALEMVSSRLMLRRTAGFF